ncbi:MAG: hypothetical protein KDI63_07095 [Gammaproteobacteria bacterium]|nr:hypothetical protein [Gammaproteobacteria bacterium]
MIDRLYRLATVGWICLVLGGCSGAGEQGPVEVRWDRDTCERCRMVLSDRLFAAQIRVFPEGRRSKVFKFDDIGCAVLWLDKEAWKNDPKTEIWVRDHRTGDWIDARTAFYLGGMMSPMQYALGAQVDPAPQAMDFARATQQIHVVERRFGSHGVQLMDAPAPEGTATPDVIHRDRSDARHKE